MSVPGAMAPACREQDGGRLFAGVRKGRMTGGPSGSYVKRHVFYHDALVFVQLPVQGRGDPVQTLHRRGRKPLGPLHWPPQPHVHHQALRDLTRAAALSPILHAPPPPPPRGARPRSPASRWLATGDRCPPLSQGSSPPKFYLFHQSKGRPPSPTGPWRKSSPGWWARSTRIRRQSHSNHVAITYQSHSNHTAIR